MEDVRLNKFITQLVACFKDSSNVYLLYELNNGGNLLSMRAWIFKSIDFYVYEITAALSKLHACSIMHWDIKCHNVMIDCEGHVKLIDLEFAKRISDWTYTRVGTVDFMAPEVILGKGYGLKADVWSFGVMLCEIICGHSPFRNVEDPVSLYEK